jgi:hypothetical protein
MTWQKLAMFHALYVASELRVRGYSQDARIKTLENDAHWMRIATLGKCL